MAEEVKNENVETKAEGAPADATPAAKDIPPQTATTDSELPKTPDLNVNDLNSVRSIIDIATTRGAFKANELEAVGKTYNKLTAFLDHVTKQQEPKGENNG
jgi:hypothetical protein